MSTPSSLATNSAMANATRASPVANATRASPMANASIPKLSFMDAMSKPTFAETVSATHPSHLQDGGKKKRSTTSKKSSTSSKKSSATRKQGGAMLDDVKNLAVPFAILLAKQGLQTMFDKKKTAKSGTPSATMSARAAAQPSSSRRKSTLSGGSCGSQCAAVAPTQMGGAKRGKKAAHGGSANAGGKAVKSRFEKLSREIDAFLQKY